MIERVEKVPFLLAICLVVCLAGTVTAQPTGYCETDCGPSTACDYQCMYGGSFTTCSAYNGDCQPECGDGACNNGESPQSCPMDCEIPEEHVYIVWPSDGIPWSSSTWNFPENDPVGGCFGNCGGGCSMYVFPIGNVSLCGSPSQNWEMTYSTLSSWTTSDCRCVDSDRTHVCGETMHYFSPDAVWRYYGWSSASCAVHDWSCRRTWWWYLAQAASSVAVYWGGFHGGTISSVRLEVA